MQTDNSGASAGTPAQAPATETVSAERVAADSGDVGAFMQASRDRRAGKAPADVTRPKAEPGQQAAKASGIDAASGAAGRQPAAVPGRDGQPAPGPKPADRDADERLTTRIREAVETSTAEFRAKNRELEEQLAALRRGPAGTTEQPANVAPGAKPAARKALTSEEIRAYQARPGAPKVDDKAADGSYVYETTHDHAVALAEFVREERESERADTQRGQSEHVARVQREVARVSSFAERIEAYKAANPDRLVEQNGRKVVPLSPEVGGLHGYAKLAEINQQRTARGLAPVPATVDHAIAEELYDSALPMETGLYLSEHPEELAELRKAQSPAQLTRSFGALEERVRRASPVKPGTEAGVVAGAAPTRKVTAADVRREAEQAVDRSVSSAKPLNGTLGRPGGGDADPEQAAIAKQDFGAFADVQRARRLEQLQQRSGRR